MGSPPSAPRRRRIGADHDGKVGCMIGVRIRGELETAYRRTRSSRAAGAGGERRDKRTRICHRLRYHDGRRDGDRPLVRLCCPRCGGGRAEPHLCRPGGGTCRRPALAAIGFIWPPLPTLLQIPLLIAPRLAFYGASGNLVTAFFAGLTAVVLNLILARAGVPRALRMIALILFFLNPLIAFYAVNGMSEMPFIYCLVQATYCYLRWADTRHWPWIVYAGLASAAMALVRYDTLFFAAAFVGAIFLTIGLDLPPTGTLATGGSLPDLSGAGGLRFCTLDLLQLADQGRSALFLEQ